MGIIVACVIVSFLLVSLGLLALWALSTHRTDRRLAELEAQSTQLGKQQAFDSRCFAHQARLHHGRIKELDERLQWMARYGNYSFALADTVSIAPVDREKDTVKPPAP
jgi:hypothetical protein